MRFNDPGHLEAWKNEGRFPKIHDDIFALFSTTFEAESVLDLCCSIGLIGQHIHEAYGIPVCRVDGDEKALALSESYGVALPTLHTKVEPATLPAIVTFIRAAQVTGITARRCIAELFGHEASDVVEYEWGDAFSAAVQEAGVTEMWIEGHARTSVATHSIPTTEGEIAVLGDRWVVDERLREAAYLRKA